MGLHLGRGSVVVLSVRFFSPKTLVLFASCTGYLGKWHGLAEKKKKANRRTQVNPGCAVGRQWDYSACPWLPWAVLSKLVVEL